MLYFRISELAKNAFNNQIEDHEAEEDDVSTNTPLSVIKSDFARLRISSMNEPPTKYEYDSTISIAVYWRVLW